MSRSAAIAVLLAASSAARAEDAPVRDPMLPFRGGAAAAGAAVAASAPKFALTAVLIAPTRRVAILNGKPLVVGETVDGAEIVAIERDAVRLRDRGKDLVISLAPPAGGRSRSVQGETVP